MTVALSPGVHLHSHINVHWVCFEFAIVNACADGQTQVLASIFHITLLFPYVYFSWCKGGGGGAGCYSVFEGTPFQFNVRSWTSCFSEWHLQQCVYPFTWMSVGYVCVRARAATWSSCHGVLITTSHTCFPPKLSTPPNPPTELLMSHVSPSKTDPAPVVASLFPVGVPRPPLSWSGSGSTASHSSLVSVFYPKTENHAIPKGETIMQLSKDSWASEKTDTYFTVMVQNTFVQ